MPAVPAIVSREREARALEMRKAGKTYEQIGAALGVSGPGAYQIVMRVLKQMNAEMADGLPEVSRLEVERLDALLAVAWPLAIGGQYTDPDTGETKQRAPDPAWLDRVVKITERRAKMLGIDVAKLELSGPGGGPLQIAPAYDLTKVSKDDLIRLQGILGSAAIDASAAAAIPAMMMDPDPPPELDRDMPDYVDDDVEAEEPAHR